MLTEQILIFIQIILLDLVLAGDNAIIIGMVASQFQSDQRKKIIFWGISAAIILRIVFTLITAYLLQITGLRLIGGVLLLYVCYKLYVDVVKDQTNEIKGHEVKKTSFFKAIVTIIIADVTMSLDNVLAVAGAAKDHYYLLIFGLVLSIALMAVAANLISKWIKKYKWIAWLGLFAILIVAIELIYADIKLFI
tara:strand:- start:873 stop:1451 length:579 start_codon:yes stop_codon:yes gene_type:complete